MKYFFDTEFYEDGKNIYPISIGIVSDDGREYYAEFADFDHKIVPSGHFVRHNVLNLLKGEHRTRQEIRYDINVLVANDPNPEFWAYYASYDWVLMCQLYGNFDNQPDWSRFYVMCLKQLMTMKGYEHPPIMPPRGLHNALADARWNRKLYKALSAA